MCNSIAVPPLSLAAGTAEILDEADQSIQGLGTEGVAVALDQRVPTETKMHFWTISAETRSQAGRLLKE